MQWKYNAAISEATKTVSVKHRVSVFWSTASQSERKQKNIFVYVVNNIY